MDFVAPTTLGTESLLAAELGALGAEDVEILRGAVRFTGSMSTGYRACLWSRVASRVLLVLSRFRATDANSLYDGVRAVRWGEHLGPDRSIAVDCVGKADWLNNSHFAELKAKDAIVDSVRDATGRRPDANPALHRRGIGRETGDAPLKENLAAAILMHAGWPEAAAQGQPLVDLMCGAGTILLEAA